MNDPAGLLVLGLPTTLVKSQSPLLPNHSFGTPSLNPTLLACDLPEPLLRAPIRSTAFVVLVGISCEEEPLHVVILCLTPQQT